MAAQRPHLARAEHALDLGPGLRCSCVRCRLAIPPQETHRHLRLIERTTTIMALTFDDTQAPTLLDMLGLSADITNIDIVLATINDLVTDEQAEPDGKLAKPSAVAAAAKRAGLEVVDASTLQLLQRDAAEGRTLKASVERQRIEVAV